MRQLPAPLSRWRTGWGARGGRRVETAGQCAVLVEMQCDLMQGFWFSRPGAGPRRWQPCWASAWGQCLLPKNLPPKTVKRR